MWPMASEDSLTESEHLVLRLHPHWKTMLRPIMILIVVVAAMLPYFHLPEAGLLLVLAVDQLLDMGRSATNVVGNAVAATVVSLWERQLDNPVLANSERTDT